MEGRKGYRKERKGGQGNGEDEKGKVWKGKRGEGKIGMSMEREERG